MERGQTSTTQLDPQLWKVVCQDTGLPLVLKGWEGVDCTEGLQDMCDQAMNHLKHTLPKDQQQRLDRQAAAAKAKAQAQTEQDSKSSSDSTFNSEPGSGAALSGQSGQNIKLASSASAADEEAEWQDVRGNPSGDRGSAGVDAQGNANPIIAFNYRINPNNSSFQNLREFAKFCILHCGAQQPLCVKSTEQAIERIKAEYKQLEQANLHYSNYLKIVEAAEQLQLLYKPETALTPDEEIAQLKAQIAQRKADIAATKASLVACTLIFFVFLLNCCGQNVHAPIDAPPSCSGK